ncbi:5-(carboxyamino)imidazole ribonucleotide synthase [Sphingomonas sinipercae]|uniref:N5-carboxyaminoimidazole ribonucleotide synthase n=1 Tax=Sphingomonas sinipercae TaxID=2714944 RepID=A0A6G7ZQF3_9SPHN|nr:5-(carboxyamino)imidazole ribonucleotide synthase [Sphingomonas sinipercae]QIL03201.1 5-(carboxyamino)imidazole ribonucleotide synthase [Sphingomonas sinipercae]
MIGPGATIGIIGGGQLGKMLAVAAAQLGYRCHIFEPGESPCAADVAAKFTRGDYADVEALRRFADSVDIATYEFENVPAASLEAIAAKLRPGVASLQIGQDRATEKAFIERTGGRVSRWQCIDSDADARAAEELLGLPLVLKTRRMGYDGKGQAWAREAGSVVDAWQAIGRQPAVAEAAVDYLCEFSVILARSDDGQVAAWDLPLNQHEGGILRRSTVPGGATIDNQSAEAVRIATAIAQALGHVGVLTVEFFATTDGPLVNEIAPRVHNSGHWTIEGALTSQFEQHIRAVCGLPLGSTERITGSATMENLLGDDIARWPALVGEAGAHVHLYGKGAPRPGRKMGHVTRLG